STPLHSDPKAHADKLTRAQLLHFEPVHSGGPIRGVQMLRSPRRQTAAMSTMRRPLGTGPSTTRSTPSTDPGPRLLPVERAEPDGLLGDVEHQDDLAVRKGRRILGPGITTTSEGGVVGK